MSLGELLHNHEKVKEIKMQAPRAQDGTAVVGLCTGSNAVDPQLETTRFQPLSLPLDPS